MDEKLKIIISAEVDKLKQNINKAKNEVKSFQDRVKEASKDVDSKFKAIGTGIATATKAAATGIAAAGGALLALGASTAEYRAEQAKLITAFEAAGSTAEQAKTTYNDLFRVLGDSGQATEAANHLAKLTTEEKALSEWTTIATGVYATFGDSLPIEGLTEAANETAKTGQITGGLADAINWAAKEGETFGITLKENTWKNREWNEAVKACTTTEDYFNLALQQCNTEAEREQLIRSTLNGLYTDAASKYEENNKAVLEQNEAQARLSETTAKLGEAVAPVITAFTNFANDALAAVVPHIQGLAETYMPKLKELLEGTTDALAAAYKWVSEHKTLLAVIGGIITGIAVAIGLYNAVAAVKAAMDALQVTTLGGLVAAYLAQAAAMVVAIAPYVLVVAAITAVIAAIVLCVKHWDTIKAKVKEVVSNIANWANDMSKKVADKFNELYKKATEKVEQLKIAAINKFEELKSKATEKVNSAKESVVNGFKNMLSGAKTQLDSIVSAVKDKFDSVKSGIKEKLDGAKQVVQEGLSKIKSFFENFSWKLPKPKIPSFSVSGGEAPWGFGGKGSLPRISIKWNKLGGVFDMPTLFGYGGSLQGIGEDGAEAVVPLEKNLGWLDKLAGMLEERMGGNTPIILNVDGKVFAQTAINTINANTRQTGKLALNLM
mgnify:CR=1 FL=1